MATVRESWRSDSASAELIVSRKRMVLRMLITGWLLVVLSVFGYLLFSPLFHPTLRLCFMTAGSYSAMEMKPIPYYQEDAVRFLSIDEELQNQIADNVFSVMDSPDAARSFMGRIADLESRDSDVYVIQISAHPTLYENRPYLKCRNYDAKTPENSSISMEEILSLSERITASMIVICLDMGPSDTKLSEDFIRDRFLDELNDLLGKNTNPNLWVLVSNSPRQSSHSSLDLRASIFSYAIAKGLAGDADLDGNRVIDLEEFVRFVVDFTQSQVRGESGGNTQQTPILLSTAANRAVPIDSLKIASAAKSSVPFSWSSIIPNLWGSDTDPQSDPSKEKDAETATAEENWFSEYFNRTSSRVQDQTMEELEDNLNILPTFIGDSIKKKVGILDDEPAVSNYRQSSSSDAADANNQESVSSQEDRKVEVQEPAPTTDAIHPSRKFLPDLSRLASPDPSNLNALQVAWQFYEYFQRPRPGMPRPLDAAPHAWNEFATYLHGIETRLRTESEPEISTLRLRLISEIVGAYQLATTGKSKVGAMAKRIASQMPDIPLPDVALTSVGLMESLAELGGPPLPEQIAIQTDLLDAALEEQTPEQFEKWHAQSPAGLTAQCIEFFWADQFASNPETPWRVSRTAILLWRRYEQLSSHPWNSNEQIQENLNATRTHLLDGTRQAIDQIGSDWEDRCLRTLAQAKLYLDTSAEQSDQLREAIRLRNQTLLELQAILTWRKIAATNLGNSQYDKDYETILASLSELCKFLLIRERIPLQEIIRSRDDLKASIARIEDYWEEESNGLVAGNGNQSISKSWKTDSLLATSLVKSQLRNRVMSLSVSASSPKPIQLQIDSDSRLPTLSSHRPITKTDEQQLQFEAAAARLAGMTLDTSTMDSPRIADSINAFYDKLSEKLSGVIDRQRNRSADNVQTMSLQELREADQALRLLPAVDSQSLDAKPLGSGLLRLELHQCLERKRYAVRQCLPDALPSEVAFLTLANGRIDFLISALSSAPQAPPLRQPRLSIQGDSSLSLLVEPRVSGQIVLRNSGKSIGQVWLLVDYDPEVLEVQCPAGVLLHRVSNLPQKVDQVVRRAEEELMRAIAAGSDSDPSESSLENARTRVAQLRNQFSYPLHPESAGITPSMGLAAGAQVTVPFEVRRIASGSSRSKIVWKLVGDDEFVRYEVITQLPQAEKLRLVADGAEDRWMQTREGVELYLSPGSSSDYRIGLRNDSGQSRILSAELAALLAPNTSTVPDGFLTDSASQQVENALGPRKLLSAISEILVPSGSETVWIPLEGMASAAAANSKSPPPEPFPIDHGLVLTLTDKATKQKYVRRIDTRIRHPRSYVVPRARYDALAERAEIHLSVQDLGTVPPDGIEVVGRIVEPLPRGTEMKLDGTILGGEGATIYCRVPAIGLRELTFELDVDGFPRAFVIKVPCLRTNEDIPVTSDFQRIEFVQPSTAISIGPTKRNQEVRLKIDSAPGAFETKRDYVEVGWDLNRDRDFAEETTFKFDGDRQTKVAITSMELGRISFTANVNDLAFDLPYPTLKNQRVNLLARMYAGGQMVWSEPVEVIADFDSPRISGIEVVPGTTFQVGVDLDVRVGVDDAGLSGVAAVEFKIDTGGAAKWEDSSAATKKCIRESDGSWSLSLPTADLTPGRANLIARAIDRVGNVSQESKLPLVVLSKEEWEQRLKSTPREVLGTVIYADNPLANAKVTLEDEKGNLLHRTNTDERGSFRIPNAPIGKLKVTAIGVVKNRPRKAEQVVDVAPPPAPAVRLRMLAK